MRIMRRLPTVSVLLLACGAAIVLPVGARAEPPEHAIADIVEKVQPSVVRIISVQPPDKPNQDDKNLAKAGDVQPGTAPATAIGSGFVFDQSGLIATNRHVVENAVSIFVGTLDGNRFRAEMVGTPAKADIAVLRINAGRPLPALTFGDSDKMRVGDTVIAIGSPFGFDNSVTAGIVSAVNRDIMESPFDDYIQTDAAINHGNSGGPLFNLAGEVVGMTSVLFAPGNYTGSVGVGFAIPSNMLNFAVDRLAKYGEVRAGMLPIRTQQVTGLMAVAIGAPGPGGALVAAMGPRGDQMKDAIRPGDVIRAFNGEAVADPRDFARKAAQAEIGSHVTLEIWRPGAVVLADVPILPVELAARPVQVSSSPPKTLGLRFMASTGTGAAAGAAASAGNDASLSAAAASGNRPALAAAPATATAPGGNGPGVTVEAVDPMGSAADSGLRKGDVILRVQQRDVATPEQALAALQSRAASKHPYAAVLVRRDDKETWLPVALPE